MKQAMLSRTFRTLTAALIFGTTLLGAHTMTHAAVTITPMKGTQALQLESKWDKIFPQSSKVEHHKVTFKNRYGITLAGDLYVPKDIKDRGGSLFQTVWRQV